MKQIRVQIEGLDDEGRGRGDFTDTQGRDFDVAVRGAFPGDEAIVKIERVFAARQLVTGKAVEFIRKGECHISRRCPHEGPCPACPMHGLDHSLGIQVKRGRIERALADQALHFEIDDLVLHPQEFGYRQKVKLMAHTLDNKLRLGVYIPYSHDFVVAEQCPYVREEINIAIIELLENLNKASLEKLSVIKAIILRSTQDGVSAIVVAKKALCAATFSILSDLVSNSVLVSVTERVQTHETNSILSGEVGRQLGPRLVRGLENGPLVDPDAFCQSDPEQATFMYDLVAEFLTRETTQGLFIDAYAGVGGFSRALLRRGVTNIIAVEQSPNALASLSQLGNEVGVILNPMSQALTEIKTKGPIEGLVVDPPKKGLMHDADEIGNLAARRLVLVSCDPDAMARDLGTLVAKGYQVERILPVDFFGGTPAVETIVMMTRIFTEPVRQ